MEVTHEILNLLNAVSEVNPYDTWRTTALHQTDKSGEKKWTNLFGNVSIEKKKEFFAIPETHEFFSNSTACW